MREKPLHPSSFRNDINGLRAWAVIVVVLYHFGIPGFGGGFIGVDIFFVISGFLMTGIVKKGLEQGTFSIIEFYMARVRRIVPALLCMCAALLSLGYLFLSPTDYKILGTHVISAIIFLSNFKFWDEAGYFDAASHDKWLLHTWSLSVEWQFYLILPVILWAIWRYKSTRVAQILAVLTCIVISLGLSVLITANDQTTAFFLLPTRAWEMLSGGLVVLVSNAIQPRVVVRRWIEVVGLGLIVASLAMFNVESLWPGWYALVPVSATMMILSANIAGSLWTSNRIAHWLGARSYSLYLWHWPVFVSLAYMGMQFDPFAVIAGLLLAIGLGDLSYRWIEVPSRGLLSRLSAIAFSSLAMLAGTLILAPAIAIGIFNGINRRFEANVEAAAAEANNVNPRREECHIRKGKESPSCVWGGADWSVIALGDSHTSATVTSLAAAGQSIRAGVVQWSYSGCSFVMGMKHKPEYLTKLGSSYQCAEFVEWARTQLVTLPPHIPVVIINRYAANAFGEDENRYSEGRPGVYFSRYHQTTSDEFLDEFATHITNSACELAKHRRVFLMRPIPEMGFNVPKVLSRRLAFGLVEDVSVSIEDYRKRNAWVWAAQDAAHKQCGVEILDPIPYLCHDGRCYGSRDQRPLYTDDDHLSEFGNRLLVPMFRNVFARQWDFARRSARPMPARRNRRVVSGNNRRTTRSDRSAKLARRITNEASSGSELRS